MYPFPPRIWLNVFLAPATKQIRFWVFSEITVKLLFSDLCHPYTPSGTKFNVWDFQQEHGATVKELVGIPFTSHPAVNELAVYIAQSRLCGAFSTASRIFK
jgi:hypothetical protein